MESTEFDVEREAWTVVLNGAESFVEDYFNEDRAFTFEEHKQLVERAKEIITKLKKENDVLW